MMDSEAIIYPVRFDPSTSLIFIRNEIDINASPEKVWLWLTSATSWYQFSSNTSRVLMINQHSNYLIAGTKFMVKTFGTRLLNAVTEYVPCQRLAWKATGPGILAYHAWLIIPTETGCKVISEETQKGWLCKLGKMLMPNRIYNYHQKWLEGLKRKAEKE